MREDRGEGTAWALWAWKGVCDSERRGRPRAKTTLWTVDFATSVGTGRQGDGEGGLSDALGAVCDLG